MKEILELIENDKDAQADISKDIKEYNGASQTTQTELGRLYCHQTKTYEHAIAIMGDVIYNKSCEVSSLRSENSDLKQHIANSGTLDQALIERKMVEWGSKMTKLHTNDEKNKIILREVLQECKKAEKKAQKSLEKLGYVAFENGKKQYRLPK